MRATTFLGAALDSVHYLKWRLRMTGRAAALLPPGTAVIAHAAHTSAVSHVAAFCGVTSGSRAIGSVSSRSVSSRSVSSRSVSSRSVSSRSVSSRSVSSCHARSCHARSAGAAPINSHPASAVGSHSTRTAG